MSWVMRVIPIILLAAKLAVACASVAGPEAETAPPYRGTVSPGCAPHDAPSVEFRLDSLSGPETVSFNVWPGSPVKPPTTVRFDASHPIGAAMFCIDGGDCEEAEWGEVQLSSSSDDGRVTGKWAIGLAGGRTEHGIFEADWLAIRAFCG